MSEKREIIEAKLEVLRKILNHLEGTKEGVYMRTHTVGGEYKGIDTACAIIRMILDKVKEEKERRINKIFEELKAGRMAEIEKEFVDSIELTRDIPEEDEMLYEIEDFYRYVEEDKDMADAIAKYIKWEKGDFEIGIKT